MKILLIRPRISKSFFSAPPTGLCYIKSYLKKYGYANVKVMDVAHVEQKFVNALLDAERPDIVGITCFTELRMHSLKLAEKIKRYNRNIQIVFGGSHPTVLFKQMLENYPFIDYICVGEGEISFLELVRALEHYADKKIEEVEGIAFRYNSKILYNKRRQRIVNLDDIPFPDYDDFNLYDYDVLASYERPPIIWIVGSRGCQYACSFCSTTGFWGLLRNRSVGNILDEIEYMKSKYGINTFKFADDIFNSSVERVIDFCDGILRRDLKIIWSAVVRVDNITDIMVRKMKEAGCAFLAPGTESGSQEILNIINKQQSIEEVVKAFEIFHKYDISAALSLIVGCPGESAESIRANKGLIKRTNPDVFFANLMTLYPNTPLYIKAKREGLCSDDFWLSDEPQLLYSGAISKQLMYKYQRELFWYYMRVSGLKGLKNNLKFGLRILRKDPVRLFNHIKYFLGNCL